MKLFVAAKVLLVNESNQILLLKESTRYKDLTAKDKWDIPGGRIDENELLVDALKRELKEEVGIEWGTEVPLVPELVYANDKITPSPDGQDQWHIVRITYSVRVTSPEITLSEDHESHVWVNESEVENYNLHYDIFDVIKKFYNKL